MNVGNMIQSGVYQMNFGGLTLAECWRFGGWRRFLLALVLKLMEKPGGYMWLPVEEAEDFCPRTSCSAQALAALDPFVEAARALGYVQGAYKKPTKKLLANILDMGAYAALHEDGRRSLLIAFIQTTAGGSTSITAAIIGQDNTQVSIVNHHNFMDDGGRCRRIVLPNAPIDVIDNRAAQEVERLAGLAMQFPDIQSFTNAAYRAGEQVWQSRIQRGLYRKLDARTECAVLQALENKEHTPWVP